MKQSIILFITLFIVGCYNYASEEQLLKVQKVCSKNGGVRYVDLVGNRDIIYAHCNNGAEFRLDINFKLKPLSK